MFRCVACRSLCDVHATLFQRCHAHKFCIYACLVLGLLFVCDSIPVYFRGYSYSVFSLTSVANPFLRSTMNDVFKE
jgi:hypothetical protein